MSDLLFVIALALIVIGLVVLVPTVVLLILAIRAMRKIDIPPNADFFETMRLIPITVPLALDLLDFVFDSIIPIVGGFIGAPISWLLLEAMGLRALRMITAGESLVPGTQMIPTLTASWFLARSQKPSRAPSNVEQRFAEHRRRRSKRRSANYDLPEWSDAPDSVEPGSLDEPDWIDEEEF